ncbi:hypothetical protein ARALYDRAFT_910662 [Arabidopsis lyrata subsp. lyrata]|uniref:Neprosin PEP catalytic domain-containing protein n=1 Tax=Arabidopsis lyrata subsp. lyrata TaxID=81972 RepID=D7M4M2_ARALL|nr:hypothetical protein ARALYDRAFT_910662 [Arabidopsis lyrata subsp. lyrata]
MPRWKVCINGNWWLLSEDIVVGYWPGTLLKDLRHSVTAVQWGGEVYSLKVRNKTHRNFNGVESGHQKSMAKPVSYKIMYSWFGEPDNIVSHTVHSYRRRRVA